MNTLFLRYLKELQNKGRLNFYENHSLSLVSTFGIGGRARVFVIPEDDGALTEALRIANGRIRYKVIGNASDLLFDDGGFCGAVLSTVHLRSLALLSKATECGEKSVFELSGGDRVIRASCGVMLPALSGFAMKNGIKGFEGLCSIPATVGGALCLNAGAYGTDISDKLLAYETYIPSLDKKRMVLADRREFSYRCSPIGRCSEIVTRAYFKAENGNISEISERMSQCKAFRKASQPVGAKCAGSYFLRPDSRCVRAELRGKSAGELIDLCGLKGMRVGGAEVSPVHANFLINATGTAKAKDVLRLAALVKDEVCRKFGVTLHEEVEFVPKS